jgi:hypothetical protein
MRPAEDNTRRASFERSATPSAWVHNRKSMQFPNVGFACDLLGHLAYSESLELPGQRGLLKTQ